MAMLYGKGNRAFIRLQEEIIKSTSDQSIFAWKGYKYENGSLFAPRPSCFRTADQIVSLQHWKNVSEFSLTNAGLDIALPLLNSNAYPQRDRDGAFYRGRCWIALLACRYEMDFSGCIALELEETRVDFDYLGIDTESILSVIDKESLESILINIYYFLLIHFSHASNQILL
jgi:hypothetical protein